VDTGLGQDQNSIARPEKIVAFPRCVQKRRTLLLVKIRVICNMEERSGDKPGQELYINVL
jgi:hypothetical protein